MEKATKQNLSHCQIAWHTKYINTHEQVFLRELRPAADMMQYYKERYKWSAKTIKQIDWKQMEKLQKKSNTPRNFAIKLTTGALPTHFKIHQTQDKYHDPCCIECNELETNSHIIQCRCHDEWKKDTIDKLRRVLINSDTAPQISSDIVHGVTYSLGITDHLPSYLENHPQTRIGWDMVFRGFLAKTFEKRQ
jgi:hypothetical protein